MTVHPKRYADYVGKYEYSGGGILVVTNEDDKLFAQLGAQPKFEIFPRSATEYFWKVVDAQITFVKNENGEVIHGIHRQGGQAITALKITDEIPAKIDPVVYDAYVDEYELAPNVIITVS